MNFMDKVARQFNRSENLHSNRKFRYHIDFLMLDGSQLMTLESYVTTYCIVRGEDGS